MSKKTNKQTPGVGRYMKKLKVDKEWDSNAHQHNGEGCDCVEANECSCECHKQRPPHVKGWKNIEDEPTRKYRKDQIHHAGCSYYHAPPAPPELRLGLDERYLDDCYRWACESGLRPDAVRELTSTIRWLKQRCQRERGKP